MLILQFEWQIAIHLKSIYSLINPLKKDLGTTFFKQFPTWAFYPYFQCKYDLAGIIRHEFHFRGFYGCINTGKSFTNWIKPVWVLFSLWVIPWHFLWILSICKCGKSLTNWLYSVCEWYPCTYTLIKSTKMEFIPILAALLLGAQQLFFIYQENTFEYSLFIYLFIYFVRTDLQ